MRTYTNPPTPCHQLFRQLQFDFRLVTVAPVTKAGLHVRHRFGVRPEHRRPQTWLLPSGLLRSRSTLRSGIGVKSP